MSSRLNHSGQTMFLLWLLLFSDLSTGVDATKEPLRLQRYSESAAEISIDGRLDEAIWQDLPYYDNMAVIEPDTLADGDLETRIRFYYTEKGLYLGVWNAQEADTLISRLSSRDQFISRDSISITLDPSGEGLYAYWFSVNLGGTLQDGTVLPERQFNNQWDGAWYGASATHDSGWSAEFFLPWSMMTMPKQETGLRQMGFYISRFVAHRDERWSWPALPRTKGAFMSQLQKVELEGIKPKQQFTFYPFAAGTYDNSTSEDSYKAGFDFFWRPSSNLQLSATVNPDFGNVESDDVVVNLTSFETFYPEKRAFFLEGNEIFVTSPRARQGRGSPGEPTTLLNTRRIGAPPEYPVLADLEMSSIEENQPSELKGAVKLTGQQGKFRYGVLAAVEDDTKLEGTVLGVNVDLIQKGREFAVARFLHEETNGGSRRSIGWITTKVSHPQVDSEVHGIDAHYLSAGGRWNSDIQLISSNVNDVSGQGGFVDLKFTPDQGVKHSFSFDYFDDSLNLDELGFVRRNDAIGFKYGFERSESGLEGIKWRFSRLLLAQQYNNEGKVVRSGLFLGQQRQFNNNHFLGFDLNYFPGRWDDRNSDGNGDYRINPRWQSGVFWSSDRSKKVSMDAGLFYGQQDIEGHFEDYFVEFVWRPSDRFSTVLGVGYVDNDGWLIHHENRDLTTFQAETWRPKLEMDLFFSAKQQLRLTAQWVGIKAFEDKRWQIPFDEGNLVEVPKGAADPLRDFTISRLTFQARYRWEIAPLSDLFIVYTRGSDLPDMSGDSFNRMLGDAWTERLVDVFVIKLRYRLGS